MANDLKHNFLSSLLLAALSVAILVGCASIYVSSSEPLHTSPALMPAILGVVLLLASLLLFVQSIRDGGLGARVSETKAWFAAIKADPGTRMSLLGVALMALYTFGLVKWLPFWLASLIFTIAMLLFLRAASWWKVLIISVALIGAIVLLFSVVFSVPLP